MDRNVCVLFFILELWRENMAAFERICSGIPEMDQALDNIRLGDNVVWRVSNLQEFRYFCEPYIEQAIKDNRRIVYFRFASHEPLVKEYPQVERIEIPLSHRFEDFTVKIHKIHQSLLFQ